MVTDERCFWLKIICKYWTKQLVVWRDGHQHMDDEIGEGWYNQRNKINLYPAEISGMHEVSDTEFKAIILKKLTETPLRRHHSLWSEQMKTPRWYWPGRFLPAADWLSDWKVLFRPMGGGTAVNPVKYKGNQCGKVCPRARQREKCYGSTQLLQKRFKTSSTGGKSMLSAVNLAKNPWLLSS